MPKRGVNLHENEIMRAYKTVNDAYIEPVSFVVPRRAEVFQNDVYPPTTGTKPALSGNDYFAGKETAFPPKISLESIYEGEVPTEIPAEKAPKPMEVKQSPAPAVTPSSKKQPEAVPTEPKSEPSVSKAPPPSSLNDSKTSMASMASKFADNDGEVDSDDASSFEEIPRPVERPQTSTLPSRDEPSGVRTTPESSASPLPTKTTSAPAPEPEKQPQTPVKSNAEPDQSAAVSSPAGGAKSAAEGIRGVLQELRSMLVQQGKELTAQGEKVEILAREVAGLKARLGE